MHSSLHTSVSAFVPHGGCGRMSRGLRAVLGEVFRVHRLHRVEANIQPGNVASRELVRGLGFRQEGFSPRYLKVGGRWRDHERWALTVETGASIPRLANNRLEPARPRPCAIVAAPRGSSSTLAGQDEGSCLAGSNSTTPLSRASTEQTNSVNLSRRVRPSLGGAW